MFPLASSSPSSSWSSWPQQLQLPLPPHVASQPLVALVAIPVALILLRVVYAQAKRFLPSRASKMSYTVKWGRERLYFSLPPPDAKLAVIRKQLAEYTQLPIHSFKLVHAGAVMKDDNAPISSYGINEKSTIAIIGTGETLSPSSKIPSPSSQSKAAPRTEETTITQIRTEMDKVRTQLLPGVDTFLASLVAGTPSSSPASSSTAPNATATASGVKQHQQRGKKQQHLQSQQEKTDAKSTPHIELEQEHVRLGELLLQSLLRLDAIHSEGEWEQARKERKGAVKEVQALLDRLDGAWRARAKA